MKKALPVLTIPPPRTQEIPQSPISVASSIPSTLLTPADDQDFLIHKASLNFATVWDPAYGKSPVSHFSGFHANPHGPFPVDVEPPSPFIAEPEEPFAILGSVGSRDPYFIGLPSPREYDRFIHSGETPEALRPKKLSTRRARSKKSENDKLVKVQTKVPTMRSKPQPMPPLPRNVFKPEIETPQSALTFAAVWDPEQGMSTFTGTRMFESTYKPPPRENHRVLDDAHVRSRYMLPTTPQRSTAVASSTLDGLDIYMPQRKPFASKSKGHRRPPSVDDEGFFETFRDSGHPDCEPHLPSRFSVTTTSTSNYINVDFPEGSVNEEAAPPPVPPIPETARLERQDSVATSIKLAISPPFLLLPARRPSHPSESTSSFFPLVRSKSSPGSSRSRPPLVPHYSHQGSVSSTSPSSYKQPRPRLSNVFGKLRRSSQDEGWVSVEVTSVITDRIIKED